MATYAVVNSGVIQNLIEWDGSSPFSPDTADIVELVPDGVRACIGWQWNNGQPIDPDPPPPMPLPSLS